MSKAAGFGSVSDLLVKNPNAKRVAFPTAEKRAPRPSRNNSSENEDGGGGSDSSPQQQHGSGVHRRGAGPKLGGAAAEGALVPEAQLGERPAPMPAGAALAIHKPARGGGSGGGSGGSGNSNSHNNSKNAIRPAPWPRGAPSALPLPPDVDPGDLAEVLEFFETFGGSEEVVLPAAPRPRKSAADKAAAGDAATDAAAAAAADAAPAAAEAEQAAAAEADAFSRA